MNDKNEQRMETSMELNKYQLFASTTAVYPENKGIEYTALGLAGEAGEYANKVKKIIRDGLTESTGEALISELGDVLWYVAMAGIETGFTLEEIATHNLGKLHKRKQEDKLSGNGDDR